MDEAALDRYAEAAWILRCERSAEAIERPAGITPWKDRAPFLREIDKSVVSLVAAMAVADAKLVNERRDAQVFALRCHLPAVLDALRLAAADAEYGARAKRFSAALEALGTQERSDEKESRPWPYDGPEGRARLTGSLDTGGSFTGDDDDPEEPS